MASAFQILPKRLCVSAAKCYFGKASEQDGLVADFISRLPDREVKGFTGDRRGKKMESGRLLSAAHLSISVHVLTLFMHDQRTQILNYQKSMSASVGLRLQLMMDNEGNYQERQAARSSTRVTRRLLCNYGNKKAQFPQHLQPQVDNRPHPGRDRVQDEAAESIPNKVAPSERSSGAAGKSFSSALFSIPAHARSPAPQWQTGARGNGL